MFLSLTRRHLLAAGAAAGLSAAAGLARPARAGNELRIGYQKYGTLILLKGKDTLEKALARQSFGVKPLSAEVTAQQQSIADTFLALGLLPKAITVADAVRKASA